MVVTFPFCPLEPQEDQSVICEIPWGDSEIAEMANSSLRSQRHIFLWVEATVAMPEERFCLESCHILRFLVIFPRRINCWVTKTWSYLGLSGSRCWINHGPRKWMVTYRVTCIFFRGAFLNSSPKCFVKSHRLSLISEISRFWPCQSMSLVQDLDQRLVNLYCVTSCATKLSDICFCSAYSQWKAMARPVHVRRSGRISLWEINNFSFTLPNPQRQWL